MSQRLKLEAVLDMQATGRLAAALSATSGPVELDASEVGHLGALTAQLLLSARLTPPGTSPRLTIHQPSLAFLIGLERLGIAPDQILN